MPKPRSRL